MNKEPDRNQRKALGKGLSALLPNRSRAAELETERPGSGAAPPATPSQGYPERFEEFQSIALDRIEPAADQPRDSFDQEKLEELSQSIRAHGVIQPITVHRLGPDRFRIIAGERRWRAAKLAGLSEIPALVRTTDLDDLLELALIENIQREDLNPIEIAMAFERLIKEYGLSHEQIAERTGKNRSTVTNFVRLLKLSRHARDELAAGNISMGHARALLNVSPELQAEICEDIKRKQLSVREIEDFVRHLTPRVEKRPAEAQQPDRLEEEEAQSDRVEVDPNVRAALDEMAMALGTRVRLVQKRAEGTGKLEIEYYSQEDLDRIYSVIVKP